MLYSRGWKVLAIKTGWKIYKWVSRWHSPTRLLFNHYILHSFLKTRLSHITDNVDFSINKSLVLQINSGAVFAVFSLHPHTVCLSIDRLAFLWNQIKTSLFLLLSISQTGKLDAGKLNKTESEMLMLITVYPFINPLALIQLGFSLHQSFLLRLKPTKKIFFIAIDCGNRSHQPTIVESRTAMPNNNWQSKINLPEMFTLSVRPIVGWINYRRFKGSWKSCDRQRSEKIA